MQTGTGYAEGNLEQEETEATEEWLKSLRLLCCLLLVNATLRAAQGIHVMSLVL